MAENAELDSEDGDADPMDATRSKHAKKLGEALTCELGGGGNEPAAAVEDEQSARDHGHGWHALFGGSFFPRAGPREAEGHESPQRDQTDAS